MSLINNTERNQPKIPRVNVPKMQQPFPPNLLFLIVYIRTSYVATSTFISYFLLFLLYDVSMDYIYAHILSRQQPIDPYVFVFFLSSESSPEILDTRSIRISTRCAVRKECRTVVILCSMFKWYGGNEKLVKWWNCSSLNHPVTNGDTVTRYIVKHLTKF